MPNSTNSSSEAEYINWPPKNWSAMSREEQLQSRLSLPEDLEIVVVDDEPPVEIDPDLDAWFKEQHNKLTPEQKAQSAELLRKILAGEPLGPQPLPQANP